MKLLKIIGRALAGGNVRLIQAATRIAGKDKVADAIDTAQDVVDVVKGKGRR